VLRVDEPCTFGGGVLRRACGQPATFVCVYCGAPFCERHGERGADYADSCYRKRCREKKADLDAHLEWKRTALAANQVSVCADEACRERMRHQCSQCKLLFCAEHLEERHVTSRLTDPPSRILVVICSHCKERRAIWD